MSILKYLRGLAAIAVALAAAGALISLLSFAPHDSAALAARSNLLSLDLGPAVARFAVLGWLGLDVLGVLLGALAAVGAVALLLMWWLRARGATWRTMPALVGGVSAAARLSASACTKLK